MNFVEFFKSCVVVMYVYITIDFFWNGVCAHAYAFIVHIRNSRYKFVWIFNCSPTKRCKTHLFIKTVYTHTRMCNHTPDLVRKCGHLIYFFYGDDNIQGEACRLTPLYPTNGLLAAFKMAAVAPMSRISYSFTPNHYILRARCIRHAVRGMKGC